MVDISLLTADSRFFSLLCNACLEVKKPLSAPEKEWRLAVLRSPSEAGYRYDNGQLQPSVPISLPLSVIRRVALLNSEKEGLNFSALAGFMQRIGLLRLIAHSQTITSDKAVRLTVPFQAGRFHSHRRRTYKVPSPARSASGAFHETTFHLLVIGY